MKPQREIDALRAAIRRIVGAGASQLDEAIKAADNCERNWRPR